MKWDLPFYSKWAEKKGTEVENKSAPFLQPSWLRRIRISRRKGKQTEKKKADRNRLAWGCASMSSPGKCDLSLESSRMTAAPFVILTSALELRWFPLQLLTLMLASVQHWNVRKCRALEFTTSVTQHMANKGPFCRQRTQEINVCVCLQQLFGSYFFWKTNNLRLCDMTVVRRKE